MNELQINLLAACAVGLTCGAIAWKAYSMGKTAASVDFMIGYLLEMSDRDLTALDFLDRMEAKGVTEVGFGVLYPALNRLEKLGLIGSYTKGDRRYYTKQQLARRESESN